MAVADVERLAQVARVLADEGLGAVVQEIELRWHIPWHKRWKHGKPDNAPVRLRRAMERLGGAFAKLGQMLSLRPDLIPQEYCEEFARLQDSVRPAPISFIKAEIERELRKPAGKLLKHIEPTPLGSASVAQVHAATLKDGTKVAIKVMRPGAERTYAADIAVMRALATHLEKHGISAEIEPHTIVDEFERYTAHELDFRKEAGNLDYFHNYLKEAEVPAVDWEHTSKRVLTMTFLQGTKLHEAKLSILQRRELAKQILQLCLKMVFEGDRFHADLHPGNILLTRKGIGLLDFGIVGSLDPTIRRRAIEMTLALLERDTDTVARSLIKSSSTQPKDPAGFTRDVRDIVSEWYGRPLKDIRFTSMMHRLYVTAKRHGLSIPDQTILLGKALVTAEGTCAELDPTLQFVEHAQPYFTGLIARKAASRLKIPNIISRANRAADWMTDIGDAAEAALRRVREGEVRINIDDTDIKHIGSDVNRSSNRLSFALIISALILGGALLADTQPTIGPVSVFTASAAGLATILTVTLIVSILREGRGTDPHKEVKQ